MWNAMMLVGLWMSGVNGSQEVADACDGRGEGGKAGGVTHHERRTDEVEGCDGLGPVKRNLVGLLAVLSDLRTPRS